MKDKKIRLEFRKIRTRRKLRQAANGLPRLSIHRSLKAFYAQVIDDASGKTLVAVASTAKDIRGERKSSKNTDDAKQVGKLIAERALKAGIEKVVFDRGSMVYHGRVKALAEAAREAGLKF
ncbi:MAG: 50S ribosomal protein L18 [Elusimicrobia bacterium CG1_02_63_36]|nr:MAG: 50S ribosomal protein L18 [Elusimicrobia bacterium CG1_02_63_36]PIP85039.1 MAG: 50S ribosomal protein L18 [Elusimicrobia bacterium CG22_combo_CG10-13_8_21_14_all_63_91]PJA12515.1 MAG: 50S ribosomal protein L18 [Elusimicrobia bacterium CG_4_10_14_0_2_um_filter_63_34]PJB25271.1 MAG: 50S ribosomal protein L18 [Elusimicrobia bacterium CG_4_9_14_3_um_filter_62_55]